MFHTNENCARARAGKLDECCPVLAPLIYNTIYICMNTSASALTNKKKSKSFFSIDFDFVNGSRAAAAVE